jgi:hypothetical protein
MRRLAPHPDALSKEILSVLLYRSNDQKPLAKEALQGDYKERMTMTMTAEEHCANRGAKGRASPTMSSPDGIGAVRARQKLRHCCPLRGLSPTVSFVIVWNARFFPCRHEATPGRWDCLN